LIESRIFILYFKNKSDLRKVFKVQFTPPLELGLSLILHLLIFHLYWNCYCVLELLGCTSWYSGTVLVVRLLRGAVWGSSKLYSGFCIIVTCCGFQQGSSWNTQWVFVWFLVLLWVQQWSTAGCSETFLGYTVDSV